jgi:hypothetical protein
METARNPAHQRLATLRQDFKPETMNFCRNLNFCQKSQNDGAFQFLSEVPNEETMDGE